MRAVIRIIVPGVSDDEALKLKKQVDKLVEAHKEAAVELELRPDYGFPVPPPPPVGRRGA